MAKTIEWQKSSFSTNGVECVETSSTDSAVLIREGDTPSTVIMTTPSRLRAMLLGIKAGHFNLKE